MQWGAMGQHLNKGPDMSTSYSTVSFGAIYGPRSGDGNATAASRSAALSESSRFSIGHLSLPTLIVLGILAWWALKQYD